MSSIVVQLVSLKPHCSRVPSSILALWSFASSPCVCVCFLPVLQFPPSSQKHSSRWTGTTLNCPKGEYVCAWCHTINRCPFRVHYCIGFITNLIRSQNTNLTSLIHTHLQNHTDVILNISSVIALI